MALELGEKMTVSTCKKTRRSTWGNGNTRNTDEGMRMVVTIEKDALGRKVSRTSYESGK